jgi:methylamine dehydrogenase accessory protein MauD
LESSGAAATVALWSLIIVLCVVVVAFARRIGGRRPLRGAPVGGEGPPLNESLPSVAARDLEGQTLTIGGSGRAQLLQFVSPGCIVCERLLPSIGSVARAKSMVPLVLSDLDHEEAAIEFGQRRVQAPIVVSREAFAEYEVPGTTYVVVLDPRGVVRAKGTVNTLEGMKDLIDLSRTRED